MKFDTLRANNQFKNVFKESTARNKRYASIKYFRIRKDASRQSGVGEPTTCHHPLTGYFIMIEQKKPLMYFNVRPSLMSSLPWRISLYSPEIMTHILKINKILKIKSNQTYRIASENLIQFSFSKKRNILARKWITDKL